MLLLNIDCVFEELFIVINGVYVRFGVVGLVNNVSGSLVNCFFIWVLLLGVEKVVWFFCVLCLVID